MLSNDFYVVFHFVLLRTVLRVIFKGCKFTCHGNSSIFVSIPFWAIAVRTEFVGDFEYIASVGESGGGLELMAGEGKGCNDVGTFGVEFGYDGVGCCVLSLTRDELEAVSVSI